MRRLPYGAACSISSSAASMPGLSSKPAPKAPNARGRAPLLDDAQILEIRALSQFAGWGQGRLAERYGVGLDAIKRFLSGVTRSRLVAKREHLPADVVAL